MIPGALKEDLGGGHTGQQRVAQRSKVCIPGVFEGSEYPVIRRLALILVDDRKRTGIQRGEGLPSRSLAHSVDHQRISAGGIPVEQGLMNFGFSRSDLFYDG